MKLHFVASFLLCFIAASANAADFAKRFDELKARATPAELYALLYDLPKGGDLHNHSSGQDRPEVLYVVCTDPTRTGGDTFYTRARFEAAPDAIAPTQRFRNIRQHTYDQLAPEIRREYVRLDSLSAAEQTEWCNSLRLDAEGEGREEFFAVIWPRLGQISDNLHVITEMVVENMKSFGAENLAYLETQFGFNGVSDNHGNLISADDAVAYVKRRLDTDDVRETGVTVRFQRTVLRFLPNAEENLTSTYAFVDAHRDLWVGINMAGIEENGFGHPARFLQTYRKLRSQYPTLALSIHAGEMDGNDSHIRDTLLLGATRIGHGVNLLKDPDTLLLLQHTRRALVEVNLISNRLLQYTPDLKRHPFPEFLRTGIPVCLNTDDRGMWDSNMTDEYYTAVISFNLSWDEIVQLGRNSLEFSFAQPKVKTELIADYEKRVAAFCQKYGEQPSAEAALKRLESVKPVTYGYAKRTWGLEFR